LELEGTFKGHLAQRTWGEQGHLQLDQVAQSTVQPGLECFQGWGNLQDLLTERELWTWFVLSLSCSWYSC